MTQRFSCLVADPPWSFGDKLPGNGRGAVKHYQTMTLAEICTFELPRLAPDCWLFLWRVSAMPTEALAVVRAWGFVPKSELVWCKVKNKRLQIGMGRSVRLSHETCIIAKRGKPERLSAAVPSVFFAPRGQHSAKPDAFYRVVEKLVPGPRVELFARARREGWTQQGLELEASP